MNGLVERRRQHPKATMREIGEEIVKRLSEQRAKPISGKVKASGVVEWETGAVGVVGPKCGEKLEK